MVARQGINGWHHKMQEETELKLSLPREQADRLKRHPLIRNLKAGRAQTKRMVGTYFDTPDLSLKRRDLSLRLREVDKRWIQTLKRMGPASGGLAVRDEWEYEVSEPMPDTSRIDCKELRKVLPKNEKSASLRALFTTDVKRTVWQLKDNEAEIELALDIGEIRSGDGPAEPICEAELELKSGNPRRLFDIALALNDRVDFTISGMTKSDRGYVLYDGGGQPVVKAKAVKLKRKMTVWQAFVAICQSCLAHLQHNEAAALAGVDPEGIHQARVAIRRLRAAFKVFKPVLPPSEHVLFAAELRWLQRELGEARDWDVFLDETVSPLLARYPEDTALAALARRAKQARERAYLRAQGAIRSRRYGRLRLNLERCLLADLQPDKNGPLNKPVGWFAKRSIRKTHKKVLGMGRKLDMMSDEALHDLRVQIKQTRYCVEFFSGLYPARRVKAHAKALTNLQDCLGVMNDGAVAHGLLSHVQEKTSEKDLRASAYVAGWFGALAAASRKQLVPAWNRLLAVKPYWT